MITATVITIAAVALAMLALCAWIAATGRGVADRMSADCDGMKWTGKNGRVYQWRNGRAFDVLTGKRVAL